MVLVFRILCFLCSGHRSRSTDAGVNGAVGGSVVVLGGDGGVVEGLVGVGVGVSQYPGLAEFEVALGDGVPLPGVVVLDAREYALAWDSEQARADVEIGAGVLGGVRGVLGGVLGVLAGWVEGVFGECRLVVLTGDSVCVGVGDRVDGLVGSGVWGLVRSAQAEFPDRFVLVDVDGDASCWGVFLGAVGSGEPQLAVREGGVFAARLARGVGDGVLSVPEGVSEWCLAGGGGTFDGLSLVVSEGVSGVLGVGEVRVGVRAAGVNFRDVLIALGMYPGEAVMGSEGAGVVLEVGPGVDGLVVGDRVFGLWSDGFGPVVVTDHRFVTRMPDGWSFVQGASVASVFLTAYHGLVDLAGLGAGERVLVHSAAGGVGMAAVQLARYLGAEVFATASPGKWDALRSLGLDDAHIASSRTLEFRERFFEQTAGQGVDVVLDSLAREFVDASLELLPRGGRFIEMGKTDVRDPDEIAGAYPGVLYRPFELPQAGLDRIQEMLCELVEALRGWRVADATRHDVGHAPCTGGFPVYEPGTPYREDRTDTAF